MEFNEDAKAQTISSLLKMAAGFFFFISIIFGGLVAVPGFGDSPMDSAILGGIWAGIAAVGISINKYRAKIVKDDNEGEDFLFNSTKNNEVFALVMLAGLLLGIFI